MSSSPVVFVPSLQNCERIWYAEEEIANSFDTMRHCFAMLFSGYSNKLWVLKMFAEFRFDRQHWKPFCLIHESIYKISSEVFLQGPVPIYQDSVIQI